MFTGVVSALVLVGALQSTDPGVLPSPTAFAALGVVERRAVMNRVHAVVAISPEPTFGLIEVALFDPDPTVRSTTAAAVRRLADHVLLAAADARRPRRVQVTASLADALSRALEASDARVRLHAMNALVLFDGDRAGLRQRLTARYTMEPLALIRAELLGHLRNLAADDPAVRSLILSALDESAPELRYQGAIGAALWTPDNVLSKVATGVQEQDETLRIVFL